VRYCSRLSPQYNSLGHVSFGIKLRIDPARQSTCLPNPWPELVDQCQTRQAEEDDDQSLSCENPTVSNLGHPGRYEEGIDEGAEVQNNGVESHYGHSLQRIAIHDVGRDGSVARLDSGRDYRS
jgi:hypothetical protein